MRDIKTIGGQIYMPSLWFDFMQTDMNDILDEAFIYVHTIKEPSNIYHEQVKALKTIVKFQNEFDCLKDYQKNGIIKNEDDLYELLLRETLIGCDSNVIIDSMKYCIEMEKPNFLKIIDSINNESLSEILSTKAVISNSEREVVLSDEKKIKREKIKNHIRYQNLKPIEKELVEKIKYEKYIIYGNTEFYNKQKMRQKVMETLLGLMIKTNISKTVELANFFC